MKMAKRLSGEIAEEHKLEPQVVVADKGVGRGYGAGRGAGAGRGQGLGRGQGYTRTGRWKRCR